MVKDYIVNILVARIQRGWIYPKTGLPLTADDILKEEYKIAVGAIVNPTQ